MSRRPQLNRQIPQTAVDKFDKWCEVEGHVNGGDKGRHAEQAIIEYLPPSHRPERFRDDLDALEMDLRADLDEAGLLSSGSSSKDSRRKRGSEETVKVTYRIAGDVQDALEQFVYDQEQKVRGILGEYVATALDEYRDGGQVARIRRYYEQLREGTALISEDRVGLVVERVYENYPDREHYHIEEIRKTIDDALEVHSEDVRDDFADRVIERLGIISVKTSDGVYATPHYAEKLVQEHTLGDSVPWHVMDKPERVEYLKNALKIRAKGSSGYAAVDYNQVRDDVFDGHPSNDYCYELMELAGEHSCFEYGKYKGKIKLRYTCSDKLVDADSNCEWLDKAANLVVAFCEKNEIEPDQIDCRVLDNRIAQAKFPDEYDGVCGPSERALDQVTKTDRESVLNATNKVSNGGDDVLESAVEEQFDRLMAKAEPITDGGYTVQ